MEWTRDDQETWDEWMREDYPRISPAIERIVEQDQALAELRQRLDMLEGRVQPPKPARENTLLMVIKERAKEQS